MAATFIVEDGTGKTDANAYATEAEVDQYNDNHNADAVWIAANQDAKEKAIRLATQYLDANYSWLGQRTNQDQALDWPRYGVVDSDGYELDSDVIPTALKNATAELAIRSANGTALISDLTDDGTVKREKSKVGSLESEVEYVDGRSPYTIYRIVDDLLKELTTGSGSGSVVELERS